MRRYHNVAGLAWATAATVLGGGGTTTRVGRCLPCEGAGGVVVASGWRQPRGAAGGAPHATVPTQAALAAPKTGLGPSRPAATLSFKGRLPAWGRSGTSAAARWGCVCPVPASGRCHVVRRAWEASENHGSGRKRRWSTRA